MQKLQNVEVAKKWQNLQKSWVPKVMISSTVLPQSETKHQMSINRKIKYKNLQKNLYYGNSVFLNIEKYGTDGENVCNIEIRGFITLTLASVKIQVVCF